MWSFTELQYVLFVDELRYAGKVMHSNSQSVHMANEIDIMVYLGAVQAAVRHQSYKESNSSHVAMIIELQEIGKYLLHIHLNTNAVRHMFFTLLFHN